LGTNSRMVADDHAVELRILLLASTRVRYPTRAPRGPIRSGVCARLVSGALRAECEHREHPRLWRHRLSEVARLLAVPEISALRGLLARGRQAGASRAAAQRELRPMHLHDSRRASELARARRDGSFRLVPERSGRGVLCAVRRAL